MGSGRNSNSFKLLWLSLLPARMKKFYSKMKGPESSQHFSHFKSIGIFPDAQLQLTEVLGPILLNFKPIEEFMAVLVTCKNEEDQIKK